MRKFVCLLSLTLIISLSFGVLCAKAAAADDVVVLQQALLGRMDYKSSWLDINADGRFDLKDLLRLKLHAADNSIKANNIKSVTVTFVKGNKSTDVKQYTPKFCLLKLDSPYSYWKSGDGYYREYDILNLENDTVFTAETEKSELDLPITVFDK